MDRVHVIVNPLSARGRTALRWEQIRAAIASHFREFKYIFTEKPQQATALTRDLLREGFDLIIGVGGDGTLNEICNGFLHDDGDAVNPEASLGIVPSGTGSDFVRSLPIPRSFSRSVEQIKHSEKRPVDLGRVEFLATDGSAKSRLFVNVADFGLGAEVIHRLARIPLNRRGTFAYYRGLLGTLSTFRSRRVTITLDGGETVRGDFVIGAVANGSVFGGGMRIAPDARPDDGLFDLVLVEKMGPLRIIGNTPRLYNGTILSHPRVRLVRTPGLRIESAGECPIELDGDAAGTLPARFTILPAALFLRA